MLARDVTFAPLAGQWAIQRAVHKIGMNSFAVDEKSVEDDFNQAIAAAMLYYRRAGDLEKLQAAMDLANQHPVAATHYVNPWQSPRTFHPGYRGMPWWDGPGNFELVRRLEAAWADKEVREKINDELDTLLIQGMFQRVFSPSALVLPGFTDQSRNGAEWSEFLLYDPKSCTFDELACTAVPTISGLVRDGSDTSEPHRDILKSPTVVTILSLDPGSRILPHCGLTNRRLIMHFALRGAEGVEFTVADETRGYGGDGHAIVFDDSFQHSVYHGGKETRYVLFAMLRHPDAPPELELGT